MHRCCTDKDIPNCGSGLGIEPKQHGNGQLSGHAFRIVAEDVLFSRYAQSTGYFLLIMRFGI